MKTVSNALEPIEPKPRPITVAYVVYNFHIGGLERCIARLSNHLDRGRFRPMIICLGVNGTAEQWLEVDDVEIVELHKKPSNDLSAVVRLARTLRSHSVDVVHSHNWGTLVETVLARKMARTPVHVHAERGMELAAMQTSGLRKQLRGRVTRWALERSDHVVAVAEAVRSQVLHRCGGLKKTIEVIPNGVSRPPLDSQGPSRHEIRQQLGLSPEAVVMGSVGRLAPVKDFDNAIAATAQLVKAGKDAHLLLVGDGPLQTDLAAKADSLGITNHVHLVGRRDDVGNWLAAMDIYVNCSVNEGMSQSILEAMSTGLPLVVTDVGDNGVLVGGATPVGLIVPARDTTALAGAFDQLIGDAEQRHSLGKLAEKRHRELYSLESLVRRYEDLYEALTPGAAARAERELVTTESLS